MRLFRQAVSAAAIAAALIMSAQPVQAQSSRDGKNRDVDIHNHTGSVVGWIYASNTGTEDWENDMLGSGRTMVAGKQMTATIDDGTGYCTYDIKIKFMNGAVLYKYGVNICAATVIDIYSNDIVIRYP